MKVLVTGGAGYIGTELVAALARQEAIGQVVVYDNLSRKNPNFFLSEKLPDKPVRFVRGDILDTRKLRAQLEGVDVVVHLAARVSTPFADDDFHGLDQVNHWGTAELGYLLEEQPVRRLIHLSSASVYGASESEITVQTDPNPRTAYGISKLRGEQMLERLGDQLDLLVLRCANVYGYSKSLRFDAVINRFMFDAHFHGRLTIHGSGEQSRPFIHVDNVARGLAAMVLGEVNPGIYNLVERNLTVNAIAAGLGEVYPELETLYIQQDMRLRNLLLGPDPRLADDGLWQEAAFVDQLRDFQAQFAFRPPQ